MDLRIEGARIRDQKLEMLRFGGQVRHLEVNSVAPHLHLPLIGGELRLLLENGVVGPRGIEALFATGQWTGASLDELSTALLGRTGVRGQLQLAINSLTVAGGELTAGDIDVIATPPPAGRGTIERDLLLELLQRQLGLPIPAALLPEQIEFVQIGAKLVIGEGKLRVLSLQGPAGPAILTLQAFGATRPLLENVDQSFELKPLMDRLAGPLGQLKSAVRERIRRSHTRPAEPY
jgi:hypothetical protein